MMTLDCPTNSHVNRYMDYSYDLYAPKKEKKRANLFFEEIQVDPAIYSSVVSKVFYSHNKYYKVIASELAYLLESIIASEYILKLQDNWDDDGACAYNIMTWKSTIDFVVDYSETLYFDFNKKILPPKIYHGPKGSIDVLFENSNYTLLINIFSDGKNAEFYGEDKKNNSVKGTINLSELNKQLIPLAFSF